MVAIPESVQAGGLPSFVASSRPEGFSHALAQSSQIHASVAQPATPSRLGSAPDSRLPLTENTSNANPSQPNTQAVGANGQSCVETTQSGGHFGLTVNLATDMKSKVAMGWNPQRTNANLSVEASTKPATPAKAAPALKGTSSPLVTPPPVPMLDAAKATVFRPLPSALPVALTYENIAADETTAISDKPLAKAVATSDVAPSENSYTPNEPATATPGSQAPERADVAVTPASARSLPSTIAFPFPGSLAALAPAPTATESAAIGALGGIALKSCELGSFANHQTSANNAELDSRAWPDFPAPSNFGSISQSLDSVPTAVSCELVVPSTISTLTTVNFTNIGDPTRLPKEPTPQLTATAGNHVQAASSSAADTPLLTVPVTFVVAAISDPGSVSNRPSVLVGVDNATRMNAGSTGSAADTNLFAGQAVSADIAFRLNKAVASEIPHLPIAPTEPAIALAPDIPTGADSPASFSPMLTVDTPAAGTAPSGAAPLRPGPGTSVNDLSSPVKSIPVTLPATTAQAPPSTAYPLQPTSYSLHPLPGAPAPIRDVVASKNDESANHASTLAVQNHPSDVLSTPRNSNNASSSPQPQSATTHTQFAMGASSPLTAEEARSITTPDVASTIPASEADYESATPAASFAASYANAASSLSGKEEDRVNGEAQPTTSASVPPVAGSATSAVAGQKETVSSRSTPTTTSTGSVSENVPTTSNVVSASIVSQAPAPNTANLSGSEKGAPLPTELSPAHQMLDSNPMNGASESQVFPIPHLAPDSALQLHVGVHTNAFGDVEVHTVIEQNQVGISIHGDREIARWFNSEMGGLENGLRSQHLNLAGVDFSSNRSGVQTATAFQQGQPRQNSPQTPGSYAASLPNANVTEPAIESDPAVVLPVEGVPTRVSILV